MKNSLEPGHFVCEPVTYHPSKLGWGTPILIFEIEYSWDSLSSCAAFFPPCTKIVNFALIIRGVAAVASGWGVAGFGPERGRDVGFVSSFLRVPYFEQIGGTVVVFLRAAFGVRERQLPMAGATFLLSRG